MDWWKLFCQSLSSFCLFLGSSLTEMQKIGYVNPAAVVVYPDVHRHGAFILSSVNFCEVLYFDECLKFGETSRPIYLLVYLSSSITQPHWDEVSPPCLNDNVTLLFTKLGWALCTIIIISQVPQRSNCKFVQDQWNVPHNSLVHAFSLSSSSCGIKNRV